MIFINQIDKKKLVQFINYNLERKINYDYYNVIYLCILIIVIFELLIELID